MKIGDTIQYRRADSSDPWMLGVVAAHSDGDPYVAIAVIAFGVPNPSFASLTPAGSWQAASGGTGAWERFIPAGDNLMAAPRAGGPGGVLTVVSTSGKSQ